MLAVMSFEAYVQKEHSCDSSTLWPTSKTHLTWKSEELHASCRHRKCVRGVIILHDNVQLHMAQQTGNLLQKFSWEMLNHPPYSLDLAPSGFYRFPILKEHLSRHCFTYGEGVKTITTMWLTQQGHTFYVSGTDKHISHCDKSLNHQGSCIGKITYYWHFHCVLSVSTVSLIWGYCKHTF